MAQRNRFSNNRQKARTIARQPPALRAVAPLEKKAPVSYGKPIIVMEDEQKNTFFYNGGAWVPYEMSIAECRQQCQVKELPQKVNRMTRFEIRCPV